MTHFPSMCGLSALALLVGTEAREGKNANLVIFFPLPYILPGTIFRVAVQEYMSICISWKINIILRERLRETKGMEEAIYKYIYGDGYDRYDLFALVIQIHTVHLKNKRK